MTERVKVDIGLHVGPIFKMIMRNFQINKKNMA